MRAPLLPDEAIKSPRNFSFVILIGLFLVALFVYFNAMEKNEEMRAILEEEAISEALFQEDILGEIPVSQGPDDWGKFLVPYWGVYSMTKLKKYGSAYVKGAKPKVDYEECVILEQGESDAEAEFKDASLCDELCLKKLGGEEVTDQYCTYISSTTKKEQCWEVSRMECWGNSGMVINDGTQDWTIKMHYDGSAQGEPDISWMHGQGAQFDFLYFGWGQIKTYEQTKDVVNKWKRLLLYVKKNLDLNKPLVIGGHSEGSTYAICLHDWLLRRKWSPKFRDHETFKSIQSYAIISGTMPVTPKYRKYIKWWYLSKEPDTVLALMAGHASERDNFAFLDVFGKLEWPKPTFNPKPDASSYNWPSFAYTCYNDKNEAMIPNPTIAKSVAVFRSQPSYETYYSGIHAYGYYKLCATALGHTAENTDNFKANTNIGRKSGLSNFKKFPIAIDDEEKKFLIAMMNAQSRGVYKAKVDPDTIKADQAKAEADAKKAPAKPVEPEKATVQGKAEESNKENQAPVPSENGGGKPQNIRVEEF